MRKPTAKEAAILKSCLEGLKEDIECVTRNEPSRDVFGTARVNLKVMLGITSRLEGGGHDGTV